MKAKILILAAAATALFAAAARAADETWTILFRDKTATAISAYATGAGAPADVSVSFSGEAGTLNLKTSGAVGEAATVFTPNTNVQLPSSTTQTVGSWTATLAFTPEAERVVSKLVVRLISFNSAGERHPGERKLKLSVGLDGAERSAFFTLPAPADLSGKPCEFTLDAPRTLSAGTPATLVVKAERDDSETLGCYFGIVSIELPGLIEDATTPLGGVTKRIPAGATATLAANVRKPLLLAAAAELSAEGDSVSLTADAGVDFGALLESGRAYVLETDFAEGEAATLLNPTVWIFGADEYAAGGNALAFEDEALARLIRAAGGGVPVATTFRLREAWTLDELFGASFEAGELKRGSALTGDCVFLYAADGMTPIKFYNHPTRGWCAVGVSAPSAVPGAAPVHPRKPLKLSRKKGADLELTLLGEAPQDDALVALVKGTDVVCSGSAFPQTLADSGLEADATILEIAVGGTRFSFDDATGTWLAPDSSDAGDVVLEDCFETRRSDATPKHVRVRAAR